MKCVHKNGKTKIDFSLKRIKVYLGQRDISRRKINPKNIFGVKDIVIFGRYERNKHDQNDVALVRLDKSFQLTKTRSPICLPSSSRFKDTDKTVFVAGWGTTADRNCNTEEIGPSKHTKCAFPFTWMNLTHRQQRYFKLHRHPS